MFLFFHFHHSYFWPTVTSLNLFLILINCYLNISYWKQFSSLKHDSTLLIFDSGLSFENVTHVWSELRWVAELNYARVNKHDMLQRETKGMLSLKNLKLKHFRCDFPHSGTYLSKCFSQTFMLESVQNKIFSCLWSQFTNVDSTKWYEGWLVSTTYWPSNDNAVWLKFMFVPLPTCCTIDSRYPFDRKTAQH